MALRLAAMTRYSPRRSRERKHSRADAYFPQSGQPSPKPLGDANVPKAATARSEPKPKKQPKIDKFFAAQRAGDQACRSS